MNHQTSLGVIGGVPKKALYLTGHVDKELVYLDPHYVQEAVNRRNLHANSSIFHCEEFRTLESSQVDPSMGLCFYIKSLNELDSLVKKINHVKEKKKNDFLSISWVNSEITSKSFSI